VDQQLRQTSPDGEQVAEGRSDLGRAAVTAVRPTSATTRGDDYRGAPRASPQQSEPSETPSDRPIIKGLGVPALHTARVGDLDIVEDLPEQRSMSPDLSFSSALLSTGEPDMPFIDLRK